MSNMKKVGIGCGVIFALGFLALLLCGGVLSVYGILTVGDQAFTERDARIEADDPEPSSKKEDAEESEARKRAHEWLENRNGDDE